MDAMGPWRTFLAVAKEKNFTQAARYLRLSQSAVSQQIKQLEDLYRSPLFVRKQRGVKLTHQGKIVEQTALQMIQLFEESMANVKATQSGMVGTLKIGASMTIAEYIVPSLLSSFRSQYPSITVQLYTGNTEEISRMLTEGQLLVGLVEAPLFDTRISQMPFLEDELGVIVPPHHSLSHRESVSFHELLNDRLMIRESGSGTRAVLTAAIENEGLSLRDFRVVLESNNPQTLKSLVANGYGISIISTWVVREEEKNGELVFLPIASRSVKRAFMCAWMNGANEDPLLASFIELLTQDPLSDKPY